MSKQFTSNAAPTGGVLQTMAGKYMGDFTCLRVFFVFNKP